MRGRPEGECFTVNLNVPRAVLKATRNPIARNMWLQYSPPAAAIIIQAFYRGQVDRRYATALAAFQLAAASGFL